MCSFFIIGIPRHISITDSSASIINYLGNHLSIIYPKPLGLPLKKIVVYLFFILCMNLSERMYWFF
jgi:hypothetical protein